MLHVAATDTQSAAINSPFFPVTGGESYKVSFSARVGTVAECNYFAVFFLHPLVESRRGTIPLGPESISLGTAKTDPVGRLDLRLSQQQLFTSPFLIESAYAGDDHNWPSSSWVKWAPSPQANCTYALSGNQVSITGGGAIGDVTIRCGSDCQWGANSDSEWIDVTAASSGGGRGSIHYVVAANPSTTARTGKITIGGQTCTITQAGKSPPLSVNSITPNSGPVTGGFPVTVIGGGFQVGVSVSIQEEILPWANGLSF